jgi:hypothetical protein
MQSNACMGPPVNGFLRFRPLFPLVLFSHNDAIGFASLRGAKAIYFANQIVRVSLYPVERAWLATKIPPARERPSMERTHLCFGAWSKHCSGHVHPSSEAKPLSSLENCPLRDQARFNEPPQRHNQLARDRYDRNPAEAALRIRDTLAIPDGKPTFRLMPKPQPS